MSRMSDRQIISIIQNEMDNAISYSANGPSGASVDLEKALKYYRGAPNGKEMPGKSTVTSTDVADSIEWLMPQIMNALTQNNQIVEFDATTPQDEIQSKVESKYCHDTLMKYNDGYIAIYYFVKDVLLNKNGIFKVYYEKNNKTVVERYSGLTQVQIQLMSSSDDIEFIELTEVPSDLGVTYDAKIKREIKGGKICVSAVPIEEFRINSNHNSIVVDNARFTAHVTKKTVSDLIAEGFDEDKLKNLPEYDEYQNYIRFYEAAEQNSAIGRSIDDSLKDLAISECYMKMDVDKDGIAEYVKVTMAGSESGTNVVLLTEELNHNPWVTGAAILMQHKFLCISIYDRLKEIQDQKTALLRNIFDNFYLQNDKRYKAVENQVNMKDLLVSRAGGVVRVKTMESLMPLDTAPIGSEAINLMNYLDVVRAGRVGVSAEGSTAPQNIGDRIGTLGLEKLMTAKEELVNLIIRTLAETGIKPLMFKIRELARSNLDTELHYKFKEVWMVLNPSTWQDRTASTIRVGTGTGNVTEKLAALQGIYGIQKEILASGQPQVMVDEDRIFTTINEICELSGLISAEKYFVNPMTPEAKAKKKQMQDAAGQEKQIRDSYEAKLAEAQIKMGDAEVQKANAQMESVKLRGIIDQQKLQFKSEELSLRNEIDKLRQELETAKSASDIVLRRKQLEATEEYNNNQIALELTKLEVQAKQQEDEAFLQNSQTIDNEGENDDE